MKPSRESFHAADYAVFVVAIVLSLSVGIYHAIKDRNKKKSNKEYLVGSRTFSVIPIGVSIIVTFTSGVSLLGNPAEIYVHGTQYSMHILGVVIGNIMGMFLFVPLFYPHRFTSCYEYLGCRYKSTWVQILGNALMLITQLFFNGVAIVAPSIALTAVTGIPVWIMIVVCGTVATVYTSIGGMKSVVWADVIQSFFIFVGLIAIAALGLSHIGGFGQMWHHNSLWERIEFFNMTPDPTERMSFWSVVLGMAMLDFCRCALQSSVQRYCALPTLTLAKMSLVVNIVGLAVSGILTCLVGMVAFSYYAEKGCDPLSGGLLRNPNQILPYFALDVMNYPGLPGIFVACIACGALSTSSSSMNATATMMWQDVLRRILPTETMTETTKLKISKALVFLVGCVAVLVAIMIRNIKGTFIQIVYSIAGSVLGPTTGLFVLGAGNPKAGPKAAILATLFALMFNGCVQVGSRMQNIHVTPLPSPTNSCHPIVPYTMTTNNLTNLIMEDNTNIEMITMSMGLSLHTTEYSGDEVNSMEIENIHSSLDAWGRITTALFSISYMYISGLGVLIVFVGGSLLSFIPGLGQGEYVPDDLLFPSTSYIRRKLAPNSQKHAQRPIYMNGKQPVIWRKETDGYILVKPHPEDQIP